MKPSDIESEIRRRADQYLPQTHLIANYYRVRRKVAYPLPIRELYLPSMPMPGITYPWATWMTWDLEERIGSLGWAAAWFNDGTARELVIRDLNGLAAWPGYRQHNMPDLSSGHAIRTLWSAYVDWDWLPQQTRSDIQNAFARHIEDTLPLSDEKHGAFESKEDILALDEPHNVLHNIPFIGTVALALAADTLSHPAAPVLNQRLHAVLGAILDLRAEGHSEGVGYDGYIMDFAAVWLRMLPEPDRSPILNHPRFDDLLDESIHLSTPGDISLVAEMSDVEPKEMPFHMCAHAKFYRMAPSPRLAWYLNRVRTDWLRADALAALRPVANDLAGEPDPAGATDAHYALTLRSGWQPEDLAVAMSATSSPMSHVQKDNGTLVIGTRGKWLISDPGYQQYLKKQERVFTLGATAHNAPVINGKAQEEKLPKRSSSLHNLGNNTCRMDIDLTPCYPKDLNLKSVSRTVWLSGNNTVVVADRIAGSGIETLSYVWHGNPDAAWWVQDGWAHIYHPDVTLWITSPQTELTDANVDRISGSRGHLSLCAQADPKAPIIWWVFCTGDEQPLINTGKSETEITVQNHTYQL
ncbi:MAG: heparinase II/III family protein [bacterium]|nr:heparinase II/III family protein [bacterium]